MSIQIRDYEQSDLAACRALWRALTARHREIYADPTIGGDDPGIYFDTYLANPKLVGPWVVTDDGEIIGLGGLMIDGTQAEIEPVVVAPAHRSRGYGSQLIRFLVTEARRRNASYLSIRPVARNIEAIRCFHRLGFTLLGHLDMFMDLDEPRAWRKGIEIHGCEFGY